jgi:hypothetical protein
MKAKSGEKAWMFRKDNIRTVSTKTRCYILSLLLCGKDLIIIVFIFSTIDFCLF